MNPNGRPTVLDQSKKEIIYALLRVGTSQRTAAAVVGIGEATIRYAKKHDAEFAQRVAQAEAMLEVELVVKLRQNAGRSWRACTYALEHLCAGRFGKAEKPDENDEQAEREIERELADMEAAAELAAEAAAKGQAIEEPPKPDPNSPSEVATRQFAAQLTKFFEGVQADEAMERKRREFAHARASAANLPDPSFAASPRFEDQPSRNGRSPVPR